MFNQVEFDDLKSAIKGFKEQIMFDDGIVVHSEYGNIPTTMLYSMLSSVSSGELSE